MKTFDLQAEADRIDVEDQALDELAAIREGVQSLNALLAGALIRGQI